VALPTAILLARHGETDWNGERRVQGHSDRPLNDRGHAQARALAESLAHEPLDAVYSSDLARARDTALAVAGPRGLPVGVVEALREKHFGTWEGLTDAAVLRRFPQALGGEWGDGETSSAMSTRVVEALRHIAGAHPGGSVLVVSHGGPLRAVLRHCRAESKLAIANGHVLRLAVDGELRLRTRP
jgi:probable phosphoglycerate mutase